MTEPAFTPGVLKPRTDNGQFWAETEAKEVIADVYAPNEEPGEARANLLRIVHAWNCHDERQEALERISKLKPEPVADGFATGPQALLDAAQQIARDALKATGEQSHE